VVKEQRQEILSRSEEETERIGRNLAGSLSPGTLITLDGALGSGKTVLAGAIAEGRGVPRTQVQSPTYVILRQYTTGNILIYHWDLYRIATIDELETADLPELLRDRSALTIIEWAGLFPSLWGHHAPRVEITLSEGANHAERRIDLVFVD